MGVLRRAFVGLLVAATAHAGDGRIEISQACVAAGCAADDLPGFPITLPAGGNYVLTSDITVPDANTTAIVADDDVSLDLAGFSVVGPVTCTGEPVTSCTATAARIGIGAGDRARIHGGSVRGFPGDGIGAGEDARIFDVIVSNNAGVGVRLQRGGSVREATVVFNGSAGITANQGGGFAEVAGCTVRGNGGDGVSATAGLIVDSRFQNNGNIGITGGAAAGRNVVTGNAGSPQISAGIDVIDCNQVAGVAVCPP